MFGFYRKDAPLLNHIILLGKQVIYQSRHLNIKPYLSLLKTKLKNAYQLEVFIPKQNNSIDIHNAKWKGMLHFISSHASNSKNCVMCRVLYCQYYISDLYYKCCK